MGISKVVECTEDRFLRVVYELADKRAKHSVAFADAQTKAGHSETEADRVCGFWADRGILEFPRVNHIALTHMGLRKAQRLTSTG
jgi:hypothetical protein